MHLFYTMKMPHAFHISFGIILTAVILIIDLLTSRGTNIESFPYVIGGVPYVAVVLTTLWMPGRSYTLAFASLTSLLTVLVLFFYAETTAIAPWVAFELRSALGENLGLSVLSRFLAVFAIWITAILTIQRKRSEERTTHLSAIVEFSDDAIIGKSLDGHITSWNNGATKIYQYQASETVGQHISMLWPKGSMGEVESEILRKIREGKNSASFETLRRKKDGTLVNVSITFSPTRDEAGMMMGLSEIARDITDRKKFEQALIEAKENAERMSRLKSSFLTNMSHEIRTPLSGILGFASILAQDASPEQYELAQLIEKSGRRLLDTINSVLDLSMLESDSFTLHPKPLDLAIEVREKVALLKPLAEKKGLYLGAEVAAENCIAKIDSACLDRILNNLIGNAIKFTTEGDVIVRVSSDDRLTQFEVIDSGIGIGQEFMNRLFQEFEQESSGMARLYEGSGLGLSITKRLVELMGGKIQVRSELGKGSVFTVSFPTCHEKLPENPRLKRRRAPNRKPLPHGKATVLVVDDDPKMRTLLKMLLESSCSLDLADNEQAALSMAEKNRYDVVIQDVNLGKKRTGIDVLHALRKLPHYEGVPVIALTAYGMPEDRQSLLNAGFDEYLSKPISEEQLHSVMQALLKGEVE